MTKRETTQSNPFWRRVQFAARILLALVGGAVFATVAWEPGAPTKKAGEREPRDRAESLFAFEQPNSNISARDVAPDDTRPDAAMQSNRMKKALTWDSATPNTPPELNRSHPRIAQSQDDDSPSTLRSNSRAPPN